MKKSLEYLQNKYPSVQEKLAGKNVPLTNKEDVIFQLALFVKEPELYSFNINLLYKYLDDEDLLNALQIIIYFFQKDTYLIKNKNKFFIKTDELGKERLFNQTNFASYLTESGVKYSPNKIASYYSRGIRIPRPDLEINGTPYWYESTVELFTKEEIEREKEKKN